MKKRFIITVTAVLIFALLFTATVSADSPPPPFPENFDDISGYSLRTKDLGWTDVVPKVLDAIASAMFYVTSVLGWLVVTVFKWATGKNLPKDMQSNGGALSNTLIDLLKPEGFFGSLFILGVAMGFILMAIQFVRRNLQGTAIEFSKIILIYLLAIFISKHGAFALITMNDKSKEIGATVLTDIANSSGSTGGVITAANYADNTANVLWEDLIYKPWKRLQFWGVPTPTDEYAQAILVLQKEEADSNTESSKIDEWIFDKMEEDDITYEKAMAKWKKLSQTDKNNYLYGGSYAEAKQYIDTHPQAFKKDVNGARIGYMLVYAIPFVIKCLLYLLVSFILLFYQLMSILFVMISPFILIFSMFPMFGGFSLMNKWFRKLCETQVMIVIMFFLLGIIIKAADFIAPPVTSNIGNEIFAMFAQAAVTVALVWKHNEIFAFLNFTGASVITKAGGTMRGFAAGVAGMAVGRTIAARNASRAVESANSGKNSVAGSIGRIASAPARKAAAHVTAPFRAVKTILNNAADEADEDVNEVRKDTVERFIWGGKPQSADNANTAATHAPKPAPAITHTPVPAGSRPDNPPPVRVPQREYDSYVPAPMYASNHTSAPMSDVPPPDSPPPVRTPQRENYAYVPAPQRRAATVQPRYYNNSHPVSTQRWTPPPNREKVYRPPTETSAPAPVSASRSYSPPRSHSASGTAPMSASRSQSPPQNHTASGTAPPRSSDNYRAATTRQRAASPSYPKTYRPSATAARNSYNRERKAV